MVYSTLDIFTTLVSTRGRVTHSLKLVVGATHTPADILAAALTLLSRVKSRIHQRKVAVKSRKLKSLAGCYNYYRGNELAQYSQYSVNNVK